jgi:hypothetical protein
MAPLYFDPEKIEIIEIPSEDLRQRPAPVRLLPLAQLLVAREFPFKPGDFPVRDANEWDDNEVKDMASSVAQDLAQSTYGRSLIRRDAERLRILGLFPSQTDYFRRQNKFGGWVNFKQIIGIDPNTDRNNTSRNKTYDDMSLHDLSGLLLERYNDLIELPDGEYYEGPLTSTMIEDMNRMDLAPVRKYLQQRFGGLRDINEHLGFPDVTKWDEHDYISYGATILRYNGPASLTKDNISLLSANKYGPSWEAFWSRFDWKDFKALSLQELQRQFDNEEKHRQEVLEYYASVHPTLPQGVQVPFEEMAQHRALSLVSRRFLNGNNLPLPARLKPNTSKAIIARITTEKPGITLADIETTAVALDIFDDLWPMNHKLRLPILAKCKRKTTEPDSYTYDTIGQWIISDEI